MQRDGNKHPYAGEIWRKDALARMTIINREFKWVPARKVYFSTILPRRDSYDDEIWESMKKDGIHQPLIVRPLPNNPEKFEIIDGSVRRLIIRDDDLVLVDVRYGVKDSEVFKISELTFKRSQRTTYERARFYARWVMVESKESGKRGAQARVAKKVRLTEGEISQYLAIHRMFTKLEPLPGSAAINFNALKNQSVNKLYELSKLTQDPVGLLKIAQELAEHPNMSVRELRHMVDNETGLLLSRLVEEDPYETEDSEEVEPAEIAKLAQEMRSIADETRKELEFLEIEMKRMPKRFLKSEVLKELQKLRRRFKRLRKDIAKLPDRVAPKVVSFAN